MARGNDQQWKIGSKAFYDQLVSSMENVIGGRPQASIEVHFPHDYMLALLLNGLGKRFTQHIPFAATLFFELHQNDEKYYVKTLYNNQSLTYGNCQDKMCEFDIFRRYIGKIYSTQSIYDLCGVPVPPSIKLQEIHYDINVKNFSQKYTL